MFSVVSARLSTGTTCPGPVQGGGGGGYILSWFCLGRGWPYQVTLPSSPSYVWCRGEVGAPFRSGLRRKGRGYPDQVSLLPFQLLMWQMEWCKILLVLLIFALYFCFKTRALKKHYRDLFPANMKKIYLLVPWLHSSRCYAFLLLPEITGVSCCSEKVFCISPKCPYFYAFNW